MSLYLSLLTLNVRNRRVRDAVSDVTAAHRLVCSGFGNLDDNESGRLLWRWEPDRNGDLKLLVQSGHTPDWNQVDDSLWSTDPMVKDISSLRDALSSGRRFQFALVANPTRKIETKTQSDGKRRNGRRVPLRRADEQLRWLERRADQAGFSVPENHLAEPEVTATSPSIQTGKRRDGILTVESIRFEGALIVTDPDALFDSIRNGIGPARAFGCGLLTLALDR